MSRIMKRTIGAALVTTLWGAAALWGQEFRGTITGAVTDSSGAVVPKARIEVRNVQTVAVTAAEANETGAYTVPFLTPGVYRLTVNAPGFKQALRDGIELHAGDKLQIDVALQVGAAAETVTVTAESEQLQTATAQMGQVIGGNQVQDLPLMGRNVFMAATLATGVYSGLYGSTNVGQQSSYGRPYDGAAAQMSFGGVGGQYQIYLNGIPNAPTERASGAIYVGFVPSPDAVEEVTVQTNLYDAQYGHTSGAVINTVLRGGSNQLHGTVYEFFRNDKLNANNFQSNAALKKRAVMRWNQPGFVVSGPVYLPKLYDGRNKTFFMASWEMIRNSNPTPVVHTVPTALQRTGDFSQTVQSNGQPILIYDPLTTTLTGGQYLRQPFEGNKIPNSRINAVGQAFINLYPDANKAGTAAGFDNYANSPNSQSDKYRSVAIRMDHQISGANRLSGTFVSNVRNQYFPTAGYVDYASPGYLHYRNNHGASVNLTSTLSPTMVLDLKYGFIFHPFQLQYYGDDFDLSTLGFPQSFISQVPHPTFPGISLSSGYTGLQQAQSQFSTTLDHSFSGTLSKGLRRHTLKAGGELFLMRANNMTPISNVNQFSFNAGFTQQNAQSGSAAAGHPLASLLLGYPSGGGVSYNIASAFQQFYYGLFVQDDWRVTSRLTLNLGLRWDYEGPLSERFNRQNRGFDFTAAHPLQQQVTGLDLKGGLLFTDSSNRLPFQRDRNNWGPRVGAAFRLFQNTVLRGGFAILYPPTFQSGNANGFSVTTAYIASNDGNLTPASSLSNPFPSGIIVPPGRTQGLSTLTGQNFTFADPERTIPTVRQYSFGVQHQLPANLLVEVAFAGNHVTEMPVTRQVNVLPRQYYRLPGGELLVSAADLVKKVTNPMAGLIPSNSSLNGATIAYQNLLYPFPQFGSLTEQYRPLGSSAYNSLQISAEKRFSSGLQGRLSFTWNKIMLENGYLNNQDDWNDLARSQSTEPNRLLTLSLSYRMPWFAKGRGVARQVFGGWEVNGIMRSVNGFLINAPGSAYSSGVSPKLSDSQRTYSHWFNTCSLSATGARQNCASADEPVAFIAMQPYTLNTLTAGGSASLPNFPLPGIRTEVPVSVDFGMFKTFSFTERTRLQFRANAYNLANTPQFGGPNTSLGSANFGAITLSQVNDPRIVELALKLSF